MELGLGTFPQAKNAVHISKPVNNVIDKIVARVKDTFVLLRTLAGIILVH